MRRLAPAAAVLLLIAPSAHAAPTCVDKNGETIRCGVAAAMPVGWTPSPQQRLNWQIANPPHSDRAPMLKAIWLIGLFLAMIALMPEFDGTRDGDWDKQEGDEE